MKRLMLMRHGAAAGAAVGGDAERSLTPHGVEESRKIARYLAGRGWVPKFALCSTARRVAETWESVAAELGIDVPSRHVEALYLASATGLGAAVAGIEDDFGTVILINHNPAVGEFARLLAERCPDVPAATDPLEFPTAGLAVFDIDAARWSGVAAAPVELLAVVTPADL